MIYPHRKSNNEKALANKGFALLIGVLITAILISISYSLFSITLKQATLSIAGKDSQIAFYAADTGLECALFADYRIEPSPFVKIVETESGVTLSDMDPGSRPNIQCNGVPIAWSPSPFSGDVPGVYVSRFTVSYANNNHMCAIVDVFKYLNSIGEIKTKIQSRGYNTCNENDPQRLERGIEVN